MKRLYSTKSNCSIKAISILLPIFIRGELGTSKIDCGVKLRRGYVCLHFQAGNRL